MRITGLFRRLFAYTQAHTFPLFCAVATLTFVLIVRLVTLQDTRPKLRHLPAFHGSYVDYVRRLRHAGNGTKLPVKFSLKRQPPFSTGQELDNAFRWLIAEEIPDSKHPKHLDEGGKRFVPPKYPSEHGSELLFMKRDLFQQGTARGNYKVDIVKELDLVNKVIDWVDSIKNKRKLPLEDFQLHRRLGDRNIMVKAENIRIDDGNMDGPLVDHHINPEHDKGIIISSIQEPLKSSTPVVPKIVHVIWFFTRDKCRFRFHNFISLLSVHKFIKPERIFFWYSNLPCGKWWQEVLKQVPAIFAKYLEPPRRIAGRAVTKVEHQADVARLIIMLRYGGIYVDLDLIAVQSWDPLLYYRTTLGAESPFFLANGVIISVPSATFLRLWFDGYRTFNDSLWSFHSCYLPMLIAKRYPNLLHIERDTFYRPLWNELQWLYKPGRLWDWSINYGVHLWYRYHDSEHDPEDIKKINTTMAEVFRYILYGSPDVIVD